MSTQPVSSSGALSSLTSGALQINGLASGLNTNQIIAALMAIDRQPVNNLTKQQSGLTAQDTQLTSIQTALQSLVLSAQATADPGLWAPSQTVSSSNSALVSASLTSTSGVGAVTGGYQVAVSQLATSAQRTYTFTSPSSADTITIDGTHQYNLAAGATIQQFANAINSDQNGTVWAAVTNSNTVVLSDRATGYNASYIQVGDPGHALAEQAALAQAGQNASFTINGGAAQSSASNTVTTAITGVSLTLNAVTTGSPPVTVNVGAPAPSSSAIQNAVTTFVNAYNAMLDQINTQVTQATSTSDPTKGTLFGDPELYGMMSSMRSAMYAPGAGLPNGMAALSDIGITTGAASGSAAPSQNSIQGKLSVNTATLASAIQTNPNGVLAVLQSWSQNFSQLVNADAQPGGNLDARIQGNTSEISNIGNQIDNLNAALAVKQQALQQQFTAMEVAMSQSQAQGSWLSSQLTSLSTSSLH